jgi:hypothetical protein
MTAPSNISVLSINPQLLGLYSTIVLNALSRRDPIAHQIERVAILSR